METSITNDIDMDGFDDAPVATEARKPNSIEQIENARRMIASLEQEIRRLEKKVPFDSIPVLKALLVKKFGRLPVKGDYIWCNKAFCGYFRTSLAKVINPSVEFHEEPYEPDADDEEEYDEADKYYGMAAHILIAPINPKLEFVNKPKKGEDQHSYDFGLNDFQAKKKEFKLLTQAEVDVLPRVITGTWTTGKTDYAAKDPKTGHTIQSNTLTTIKVFATSTAEAEKAYASVLAEVKKELKKAPEWKGKVVRTKADNGSHVSTLVYCFRHNGDADADQAYRPTDDMGKVTLDFYMGKKIPKGGRKVTKKAVY